MTTKEITEIDLTRVRAYTNGALEHHEDQPRYYTVRDSVVTVHLPGAEDYLVREVDAEIALANAYGRQGLPPVIVTAH